MFALIKNYLLISINGTVPDYSTASDICLHKEHYRWNEKESSGDVYEKRAWLKPFKIYKSAASCTRTITLTNFEENTIRAVPGPMIRN